MMWDNDGGAGWWIAMWLMMVVFWALVAATVVWVVSSLRSGARRDAETPEATLARRLAAGEIDEAQYRSLRQTLHDTRHPHPSQ
jgi:uncharacterized membrane protein